MIDHATGALICADLDCGSMELYECNPATCTCLCDSAASIPPEVMNQRWPSKVTNSWNLAFCATVYNVYQQAGPLTNCGGVACSYGLCEWSGLVTNNAAQVATPPVGTVYFYLVTGENVIGEGTMGFSSAGFMRPNLFPCPTPPPP